MLITRVYSWPSSRLLGLLLFIGALTPGCSLWDRIFDPVDEPGELIALEPKFPSLLVGESVELAASVVGAPGGGDELDFEFTEDSQGSILQLAVLSGGRVLVTGLNPGQATVTASLDGDEGLSIVTVRTEGVEVRSRRSRPLAPVARTPGRGAGVLGARPVLP